MKNIIKTILSVAVAAISLHSCSYKPEVHKHDTVLTFTIDSLKGTQLLLNVKPADDLVNYIVDVVPAADLDDALARGGEDLVFEYFINYLEDAARQRMEMFREHGDHYIASFEDIALYTSYLSKYIINLTPLTDYAVVGFCIDPDSKKPLGRMQTLRFRTTDIHPAPSRMELSFMIQDTERYFYYYVKPLLDGKLCREPYLSDVVEDEVLYGKFDGDISAFIQDWYQEKVKEGTISQYLKNDISRNICPIIDKSCGGNGYTVIGAPYNLRNMDQVFHYHFVYQPGIKTSSYTRDN